MNPTNEQELRAIVGEIPNYIFECLELSDEVKEEWKHGSKASDFGSHNQFVQMFSRRIQAHTNAEIAKAVKEAKPFPVGGSEFADGYMAGIKRYETNLMKFIERAKLKEVKQYE